MIKIVDVGGAFIIKGDIEFELSEKSFLNEDNTDVYKYMRFRWSPEGPSNFPWDDKNIEMVAEKLKQDFIEFINQKPFLKDDKK